jgi:hypothetical protein
LGWDVGPHHQSRVHLSGLATHPPDAF